MKSSIESHFQSESGIIISEANMMMKLNAEATTLKSENVDDKCGESTEITEISETSRDSFDEYKAVVDDFHKRMDLDSERRQHAGATSGKHATREDEQNLNSGSTHSNHSHHFAEIWYPECRDCPCCRGFKHGCSCVATNNGVCMCVTGGPDDVSVMTINSYDFRYQQQQQQLQCQFCPIGLQFHSAPMHRVRKNNKNKRGKRRRKQEVDAPCRFFFSVSGCRHGDACPYSHTREES
jgi:hypothetical protein